MKNCSRGSRSWFSAVLLLAWITSACASRFAVERPSLVGVFEGVTADGEVVELVFDQQEEAFRGSGTISNQPVALAGPVVWRGLGTLQKSDATKSVALELSNDGQHLELRVEDGESLSLNRVGDEMASVAGAWSGRYLARHEDGLLARAALFQDGTLVTGLAVVLGRPAGVSGRLESESSFRGHLTFSDGNRIPVRATREPSGALELTGLGGPIRLERRR